MASGVSHFPLVGLKYLFSSLDTMTQRFFVLVEPAKTAFVQCHFGIAEEPLA